jgi:hypothetical protein
MKFPFDFNITLIFRLVFPGIVLATAAMPALMGLVGWLGIKQATEIYVLPVAAVIFGWLIVLGDQPIYMFLEGRGFAPGWLLEWMRGRQAKRLAKLHAKYLKLRAEGKKELANEVDIKRLDYPVGKDGEFYARMPTRLGNLLYSYETYSNTAYKIDSIFYWYRLWVVLDKDLRSELTETQAIADSAVYVCFASYVGMVIVLLYTVGGFVAQIVHRTWFNLPDLPSPFGTVLIALGLLLLGLFLNWLALFYQRGYGEFYKSLFDQFRDKLAFADGVSRMAVAAGGDPDEANRNKFRVTSRYLRWHRIRPTGEANNWTPEAWAARGPQPVAPIAAKQPSMWSRLMHRVKRDTP